MGTAYIWEEKTVRNRNVSALESKSSRSETNSRLALRIIIKYEVQQKEAK